MVIFPVGSMARGGYPFLVVFSAEDFGHGMGKSVFFIGREQPETFFQHFGCIIGQEGMFGKFEQVDVVVVIPDTQRMWRGQYGADYTDEVRHSLLRRFCGIFPARYSRYSGESWI